MVATSGGLSEEGTNTRKKEEKKKHLGFGPATTEEVSARNLL